MYSIRLKIYTPAEKKELLRLKIYSWPTEGAMPTKYEIYKSLWLAR